jgi:hypothetical protein
MNMSEMIFLPLEQGSEEWLAARAGVITASIVRDVLETLKDGKTPTSKARLKVYQLGMERVAKKPVGEVFNSWQLRRGQELEHGARQVYEERTGNIVQESGIVLSPDRLFGYSTDGFIDADGMVEIKCLISAEKVYEMLETGDVGDYMHQMQTGLWLTGRKWCDFIMYVPELEPAGNHLYVKRIFRDEAFIDEMVGKLLTVAGKVAQAEAVFRKQVKETQA